MGQALIRGLIANGVSPQALRAADPSRISRGLASRLGVRTTARNDVVARATDVIVLAVKPQEMAAVVTRLAPYVGPRQLVISIAAGVTLHALQSRLPGVPVVRVMPNLPATVGSGFAACVLGRHATALTDRVIARRMRATINAVRGTIRAVLSASSGPEIANSTACPTR